MSDALYILVAVVVNFIIVVLWHSRVHCYLTSHDWKSHPIVDTDTEQWAEVKEEFPENHKLIEGLDEVHLCGRCDACLEINVDDVVLEDGE